MDQYDRASANVGKSGKLQIDGWRIPVVIVASRVCYGRVDYKVAQPTYPEVSKWVSSNSMSIG